MKLATAHEMRVLDATAIESFAIPAIILMENAGHAVVTAMTERLGPLVGREIAIFAGPGNNGGDGLVIARHLHQLGALPSVFLLAQPESLRNETAANLTIVRKLSIPLIVVEDGKILAAIKEPLEGCFLVVDAIFGTGLTREVIGVYREAIELINELTCPVVAVDVPSGLASDTGQTLGACVKATLTVTFGLPKPGLVIQPGAACAGQLQVADIGIPPEAVAQAALALELLAGPALRPLIPARNPAAHKGSHGHLGVLAGSIGKTGAALLAARGALRAGAGLVTLAVPADLNTIFALAMPEAMTLPLPRSQKYLSVEDYDFIVEFTSGKKALAVGPGLGTNKATAELVIRLYCESPLPMVLDADGINILAANQDRLNSPPAPRILTPHPGEMSRLTDLSVPAIQAGRIAVARNCARDLGVYCVLKGNGTIIAAPDGKTAVNPTGNPGMASGGMGDVLTGIIGGLLCQGLSPWNAARLGVYVHGLAADLLAREKKISAGFLASEVADSVPAALAAIAEAVNKK